MKSLTSIITFHTMPVSLLSGNAQRNKKRIRTCLRSKYIITTILIVLLLVPISGLRADQIKTWMEMLENPKHKSDILKPDNYKQQYVKYDFSPLLMPRYDFLGYIDPEYQRLKIKYTSIEKDREHDDTYIVKGYTIVMNNRCDFEGHIRVTQIREYKKMHYGIDDEFKDKGIKSEGLLLGEYEFYENKEQKFSGIFKGILTLYWFVDRNGQITYDNTEWGSDSYCNNQYVGQWCQYGKNKFRNANWGELRIPLCGDLDMGAGEFWPDPKYRNNGWQDRIFQE